MIKKAVLSIVFVSFLASIYGQDKYNHIGYNKFIELKGSEYIIASVENISKFKVYERSVLFINTLTGEYEQVKFCGDSKIEEIEQLKVDSLDINMVLIIAKTIDFNSKAGIDWDDPKQLFVFSIDGKERTQVTDNDFFVRTWVFNSSTGCIVVAGHYDTNKNGKYDYKDKEEVLIYNIKTKEVISRI